MTSPPTSPLRRNRRTSSGENSSPLNINRRRAGSITMSPPTLAHSPSASHSLAAAAALNAGLRNEANRPSDAPAGAPSAARRRSSIVANLDMNDPSVPGPGEMAMSPVGMQRLHSAGHAIDPNHHRQPSLGEIHQELEYESEAVTNRLVREIRHQRDVNIESAGSGHASESAIHGDASPRPSSAQQSPHNLTTLPSAARQPPPPIATNLSSSTRSPLLPPRALSRHSSYQSATSPSPSIRPLSGHFPPTSASEASEFTRLGSFPSSPSASGYLPRPRDEGALLRDENQMIRRENEMLLERVRQLEAELAQRQTE